jgi:hypothetical protein
MRISDEVRDHLLHLVHISPHEWEVFGEVQMYGNIVHLQRIGQELEGIVYHGIEGYCRSLWSVLARQGKKGAHETLAAFGGSRYLVNQLKQGAMIEFFPQEIGMHEDHC